MGTNDSVRDDAEEALDLVLVYSFQDSSGIRFGDGRGVRSNIAAICGDEIADPGDIEPAVELSHDLTLGIR